MEQKTGAEPFRYDAFISYRHAEPDIRVAERLHRLLETYKTPRRLVKQGVPRGVARAFIDRQELPTSSDLGEDIEKALKESKNLIVVCSPRTPGSRWVSSEIEMFKAFHGNDGVLALLMEGEPDEAFPPALTGEKTIVFEKDGKRVEIEKPVEPLAADIRAASLKKALRKLKIEKLRILAPILGCRFDDLKQRHRERGIRRMALVAACVAAFSIVFSIFTLYQLRLVKESEAVAVYNEKIAKENEKIAKENERKALTSESNTLSEMSKSQTASGKRLEGIKLALEALPGDVKNPDRPFVPSAELALYNAYYGNAYQGRTVLEGHSGIIQHIAFSNDGKLVATASQDFSVRIWQVSNGKCVSVLTGHTGPVDECSFSPDDKRLITLSDDGTARVWDVAAGKELRVISGVTVNNIAQAVFDADGDSVIIASSEAFRRLDIKSGEELYGFRDSDTRYLACINALKGLAVLCETNSDQGSNGTAARPGAGPTVYHMYDLSSDEVKANLDINDAITGFAYSSDASKLITLSLKDAKVWDVQTGSMLATMNAGEDRIDYVSFSPDGKYVLAQTFSGAFYVWDEKGKQIGSLARFRLTADRRILWMGTGESDWFFQGDSPFVTEKRASFSPDGKNVLLYADNGGVGVFNIADVEKILGSFENRAVMLKSRGAKPQYAVYNKDGSCIAVSYDDYSVCLFDTTGTGQTEIPHGVYLWPRYEYGPDGKTLFHCEGDSVVARDIQTGEPVRSYSVLGTTPYFAALSPDGRLVAAACGNTNTAVWDAASGKEAAMLMGQGTEISSLAFSRSGERLAVGFTDGGISLWNPASGKMEQDFKGDESRIMDMTFSPDGSQLAASSQNAAFVWDLNTGKKIAELKYSGDSESFDPDGFQSKFYIFRYQNLDYSSDGKKLLVFSATDSTIRILDPASMKEITTLKLAGGFKNAVLSPDGTKIATLGKNSAINIWDAETGTQLKDFGNRGQTGSIVRYSPDGRYILAGYDKGAYIYDAETCEELICFEGVSSCLDGGFTRDAGMVYMSDSAKTIARSFITDTQTLIDTARNYLNTLQY